MSGKFAATAGVLAFALAMSAPGAWAQMEGNDAWQELEQDDMLMNDRDQVDETRIDDLQQKLEETEQRYTESLENIREQMQEDEISETRLQHLQESLNEQRDEFQSEMQELRGEMDEAVEETRVPGEDGMGRGADETRIEEQVMDDLEQARESFSDDLDRAEESLNEDIIELDRQIRDELEAVVPEQGTAEQIREDVEEAILPDPAARPAMARTWMAQATVGLNNFTGDLNDNLRGGFGYGARGIWNADQTIGAELGYVGGVNQIEGEGILDVGDWTFTNGADAVARISWVNDSMFRPFAVGGLGILHLNSFFQTKADLPTGQVDFGDAFMMTVPIGGGVAAYPGDDFVVGARFDYRFQTGIIGNELPDGNNWTLGVDAGLTF